jgi:hypothetical protein
MIQGDRVPDNQFSPQHQLYIRCKIDEVLGDRLNPPTIHCDNTSTNWSKYGKPWDVIFDYPCYGIGKVFVRDLPDNLQPKGSSALPHGFRPQHVPLSDNYPHAEIWAYRAGARIHKISSSLVRKEFRQIISDRSFIILRPQV